MSEYKNPICPLLAIANAVAEVEYPEYCVEGLCAWWRSYPPTHWKPTETGECAVLAIARSLEDRA